MCSLKMNVNILAIFLVALLLSRFEPSSGLYLGRRHVDIINKLDNGETLMIHCWKNGANMGKVYLKYEEEFKLDFVDLFTFQHVNIECDMEYKDRDMMRRGHFVVYDSSNDDVRTRECYRWCNWSVGRYGLYAYDEVDHKWDYEIPWPGSNTF